MDPLAFHRSLADHDLLARLETLAGEERKDLAGLLACMAETDRRRLYAEAGYHGMFAYCVARLRYAEGEAYRRLQASRAAVKHPEILVLLMEGALSLTAVSMLAPHLGREDRSELLARAQGLSQNKLELLLAGIAPERARRDCIRYLGHAPVQRLPTKEDLLADAPEFEEGTSGTAGSGREPPAPRPADAHPEGRGAPQAGSTPDARPLGLPPQAAPRPADAHPEGGRDGRPPASTAPADAAARPRPLVRFSFTADEGLLEDVERARDLLRHKHPHGRLEEVFREALHVFLEHRDPDRKLARKRDREGAHPAREAADRSRRVPQWVREKAWERDGGRCAHVAPDGRRCEARGMLEFDHIVPWALGGLSGDPDNIRLLCRAHNQLAGRTVFGRQARGPGGLTSDEPPPLDDMSLDDIDN